MQALRAHIKHIDYVIYTHGHADHVHGFCDLAVLARKKKITLIMDKSVEKIMTNRFDYLIDTPERRARTGFELMTITGSFEIGGLIFHPVDINHGKAPIYGYRFGNFAYLTDTNEIPRHSYELLRDLDILVIDGLQISPHETHFSFEEALIEIGKIQPKRAFLIHMAHSAKHVELQKIIASVKQTMPAIKDIPIEPSYDGLEISFSLENFDA
jgi:phosphoribosyl 1,2-cyclic phosphate phosphodiesterase